MVNQTKPKVPLLINLLEDIDEEMGYVKPSYKHIKNESFVASQLTGQPKPIVQKKAKKLSTRHIKKPTPLIIDDPNDVVVQGKDNSERRKNLNSIDCRPEGLESSERMPRRTNGSLNQSQRDHSLDNTCEKSVVSLKSQTNNHQNNSLPLFTDLLTGLEINKPSAREGKGIPPRSAEPKSYRTENRGSEISRKDTEVKDRYSPGISMHADMNTNHEVPSMMCETNRLSEMLAEHTYSQRKQDGQNSVLINQSKDDGIASCQKEPRFTLSSLDYVNQNNQETAVKDLSVKILSEQKISTTKKEQNKQTYMEPAEQLPIANLFPSFTMESQKEEQNETIKSQKKQLNRSATKLDVLLDELSSKHNNSIQGHITLEDPENRPLTQSFDLLTGTNEINLFTLAGKETGKFELTKEFNFSETSEKPITEESQYQPNEEKKRTDLEKEFFDKLNEIREKSFSRLSRAMSSSSLHGQYSKPVLVTHDNHNDETHHSETFRFIRSDQESKKEESRFDCNVSEINKDLTKSIETYESVKGRNLPLQMSSSNISHSRKNSEASAKYLDYPTQSEPFTHVSFDKGKYSSISGFSSNDRTVLVRDQNKGHELSDPRRPHVTKELEMFSFGNSTTFQSVGPGKDDRFSYNSASDFARMKRQTEPDEITENNKYGIMAYRGQVHEKENDHTAALVSDEN